MQNETTHVAHMTSWNCWEKNRAQIGSDLPTGCFGWVIGPKRSGWLIEWKMVPHMLILIASIEIR